MHDSQVDVLGLRIDRLEQEHERWNRRAARFRLAACAVLVAVFGSLFRDLPVRTTRAQQPDAKGLERSLDRSSDPQALYEDQQRLARKALSMIDQATRRGIPAVDQATQEYLWSTRLLGAQIYLSLPASAPKASDPEVFLSLPRIAPDPKRLAAFETHLRRMKIWEDRLHEVSRRGALSVLDLTSAEYRRLQAEIWLARERLKTNDQPAKTRNDPR